MSEEILTIQTDEMIRFKLEAAHLSDGTFELECTELGAGDHGANIRTRIVISRAQAMDLHAWLGRRFMVGANEG